jgi:uncharacterized membrane protein
MESIKMLLENSGDVVSVVLEFTSVICIVIGFISALFLLTSRKQLSSSLLHRSLKLKFGGWLALALEFQLASDIVRTTITPTYDNLIQLAALAIIRTFLNYFLSKELKEESEILLNAAETDKLK